MNHKSPALAHAAALMAQLESLTTAIAKPTRKPSFQNWGNPPRNPKGNERKRKGRKRKGICARKHGFAYDSHRGQSVRQNHPQWGKLRDGLRNASATS